MRATIDIAEEKRFLRPPIYTLTCDLEFNEVERTIIRKRGLDSGIIYDEILDPYSRKEPVVRTLKEVMKQGITTAFRNPLEAAAYRQRLEEVILPYLKQHIEVGAVVPNQGPRTIEL
jgi:hypothetical protein